MSGTPTMTTVGGWLTVLAVGGGLYYISNRKEKSRLPPSKQTTKAVEVKKDAKIKKGKKAPIQSDGDSEVRSEEDKKAKRKAKKAAPAEAQENGTYTTPISAKKERDEEADNREFARQMSKAKTGEIVAPKSKGITRQKSVKQSQAQKADKFVVDASSDNHTAPSSTNGADADDDQSPAASPNLSATIAESPNTNGISDMLEKPRSGPSVLNITAPTNEMPHKKAKKPAAVSQQAETKKQRQNRQKAERAKVARQEEEAERQKLLEQQRRTARVAEGRAAKDGSSFMASTPPATSSWTKSPVTNGTSSKPTTQVDLLDTTETPSTQTKAVKPAERTYTDSEEWGSASLPSEEEQLRILSKNDNWETVKTKEEKIKESKARKAAKAAGAAEAQRAQDEAYGIPPVREGPYPVGQKYETVLTHVEDDGTVVERTVVIADSDWVVSSEGAEWEVS